MSAGDQAGFVEPGKRGGVMADNCPICTEGLRALVALLDDFGGDPLPVRKLRAERHLVAKRLEMAVGGPVVVDGVDFRMVESEPVSCAESYSEERA
jgi:hypothetical protein